MKLKIFHRICTSVIVLIIISGSFCPFPMFSEKNLNEVSAASQADVFNTEVLPDGGLAITGYNGNSENVTIPASVSGRKVVEIKSLGKMNSSIKSLRITDGVKKINRSAFESYSNLKSLFIPDSVTYLGDFFCSNCASLENVRLPVKPEYYGSYHFSCCKSLKQFHFLKDGLKFLRENYQTAGLYRLSVFLTLSVLSLVHMIQVLLQGVTACLQSLSLTASEK